MAMHNPPNPRIPLLPPFLINLLLQPLSSLSKHLSDLPRLFDRLLRVGLVECVRDLIRRDDGFVLEGRVAREGVCQFP